MPSVSKALAIELAYSKFIQGRENFIADQPRERGVKLAPGQATHDPGDPMGEENLDAKGVKGYPARWWVVERNLAWPSKCRAIMVRYEKKVSNYMGLIQLACALLWYPRQRQLEF